MRFLFFSYQNICPSPEVPKGTSLPNGMCFIGDKQLPVKIAPFPPSPSPLTVSLQPRSALSSDGFNGNVFLRKIFKIKFPEKISAWYNAVSGVIVIVENITRTAAYVVLNFQP